MKIKLLFLIIVTLFSLCGNAQYTKLHDFGGTQDGTKPYGDLYFDGTYFYGVTAFGGSGICANGCGTIFKIKSDGTGYVKLFDFNGTNGANPYGSLIPYGSFLYGMTMEGGISTNCTEGCGTIFKIKNDGTGYTKLFDFVGGANGSYPYGSLFADSTFLYGTTLRGGVTTAGVLFKIKHDGTGYASLGSVGMYPRGTPFFDGTFLFGMSWGSGDGGNLYKIKPNGTDYANLLNFTGVNGAKPHGSIISDGNFLYGMTAYGGTSTNCINGCGTVFKIKPDGTEYTKLFDFAGTLNGARPYGSLIYDGAVLYGMTNQGGANNNGVLFKINLDGTRYVKLFDFADLNGYFTWGSLILDGTNLYGMTVAGGANNKGVIFKYGLTTGLRENNLEKDLNIYPNPTNGTFQISGGELAITDLHIYNVLGEMVYAKSPDLKGEKQINVSLPVSISNGIYFVKLKTEEGRVEKKLVLSR